MRFLIDTHVLLWTLFEPERIPKKLRDRLLDPENEILVSVASAWEIAIKKGLGKIVLPGELEEAVLGSGFGFLPITPEHCDAYGDLPNHDDHRDPFDRMLAVQARLDGCRLISRDAKLDRYGVRRIW
jgi:PIN domain nuclease of toxin-antitoxin system